MRQRFAWTWIVLAGATAGADSVPEELIWETEGTYAAAGTHFRFAFRELPRQFQEDVVSTCAALAEGATFGAFTNFGSLMVQTAEGMAEWTAFHVLERLRLDTLLGRRAAAMRGVRGHPSLAEGRLDLETLSSPQGFTTRHLRDGSQQTYQLAFLLADHLIRREGFERVVEYFRLFGERADRHANFTAAFGQSLAQFEQEALAHLASAVR